MAKKREKRGGAPGARVVEEPPFRPNPQLVCWREGGSKESAMREFIRTWERMERERGAAGLMEPRAGHDGVRSLFRSRRPER